MVRSRLLLTALLLLSTPLSVSANAIDWADGYWGLSPRDVEAADYKERNCEETPVEIRIDKDNNEYWSKIGDQEPRTAIISEVTPHSFKINYRNETRIMDDGRLHIWTIVFVDKDSFYWVREDWKSQASRPGTFMRYRCLLEMS